jgi:hypothetical protein
MCLALYLSCNYPIPHILYDDKNPSLHTQDITDEENRLKDLLSFPNIKYIGSDLGCSCGFRHALLNGDEWLDAVEEGAIQIDNTNHDQLVELIMKTSKPGTIIELLACWEGDHGLPILYRDKIKIEQLLSMEFHFKERSIYTVEIDPQTH